MTFHEEAGKGSFQRQRDKSVTSKETFESNWDRIFKKNKDVDAEVVEAKVDACTSCHGKGGAYDCGWYYECTSCGK